ncbi:MULTISPECIES: DUF3499 domain-containing protein [unclassified Arthrobacter]|uniref:DUF3499 domain-containing protein n=1 Tax=unclassified Arthrobacter TaxID=235627 RepID=UPI0024E02208|nr:MULTISPECIES: DUF3499 domain-containing protein [unclassified Arthrobacter]MCC9146115.1 DUF3499 domain-containing protein [Arthrobacter sp. zg-Y919]MDK1277344.1 DUF3499 domain-containing protein [Arthrobacter sp. zg.Y919]MDM7990519.1 DUF3499 domain-containing protein [Arthrobacter sp. zg-Y877]WIB03844.1 DUF3499 domain-containing protein [Arthrobacter sp. zg-Y919]
MESLRQCSRSACRQPAVATLTYVYADSTAVLGPLATYAEPHCYDLCAGHSARLTAPLGWELVRLNLDGQPRTPSPDELSALVDAVREQAEEAPEADAEPRTGGKHALEAPAETPGTRRAHLRVLREQN